MMLVVVIRSLF